MLSIAEWTDRALALSSPMKLTSSASFSPSIRISLRLKIHQAQAKNFCRVLDIRVPQIVEPYLWQSCPRQYPEQHMQHAIWGDGVAVRRWEYILTSYFFLLRLENFYCISRDGDVAIKVFLLSAAPPPPSHLGGESLLDKSQAAPWHI